MKDDFANRGFHTLSVDGLSEYRSRGLWLRHEGTGAEVYHMANDDRENLFSFVFRTPPSDHTGVPHILEHVVLCGSRRFPLKDPFLVMLKGSVHTFLNAMTYPDKTVYPASSVVPQDYRNLLRVYGDAVFFPLLTEEAFRQEGHRLEEREDGTLARAGIVLNEMKGSYSTQESVAGDATLRSLFPDVTYRWDSGGDPRHIPDLTYEAFKAFHEKWYHPSNVRVFLYGNQNLDDTLAILDEEIFSHFQHRRIDSAVPLQERWSSPKEMEAAWPAAPGEPTEGKSTISVNWLLGDSTDPGESLSMEVLSFLLLGHGGAPLQQAIMESEIGEDLSPVSGFESGLRQMVFSAAVRGTDPGAKKDFEALVEDTLSGLAKGGLDPNLVEGALRSVEFRVREIRGGMPFGLRMMKRAVRGWLHGAPPSQSLLFDHRMGILRTDAARPGYFEDLIRRNFLENRHRTTVTVVPDPEMRAREDAEEKRILEEYRDGLDVPGRRALIQANEALEEFQQTPDSPEDLARIPFIRRNDLPLTVETIDLEEGITRGVPWFRHQTFTNGVAYVDFIFELDGLEPDAHRWLPLFSGALTDVGIPGSSYDEVSRELALKTGGLGCSLEASSIHPVSGGGMSKKLFVRLKLLENHLDEGLDLTSRILRTADFHDSNRVRDLLLEMRNDFRSSVVPSGSAYAALRASTRHSASAPWEELWYGSQQLMHLQEAAQTLDTRGIEPVCTVLTGIRDTLIRRGNLRIAVTADPTAADVVLNAVLEVAESMAPGKPEPSDDPPLYRHAVPAESLVVPSSVSFSALSLPAALLGTPEHARQSLMAHVLRTGYLWENVRMKGGAYGASASVSGLEGSFTFSSYRDPVILPTLEAFRASLVHIRDELGEEELNLAVIGTVGKELRPLSPGEKGMIAIKRRLYGINDPLRQARRDALLAAEVADIRAEAARLLDTWEQRAVTVVAGSDALDKAAQGWPELGRNRIDLPS